MTCIKSLFISSCVFLPVIVDPQSISDEQLVGERNNRRGLGKTPFYEGSIAAINLLFSDQQECFGFDFHISTRPDNFYPTSSTPETCLNCRGR